MLIVTAAWACFLCSCCFTLFGLDDYAGDDFTDFVACNSATFNFFFIFSAPGGSENPRTIIPEEE
jgi:hypothetical protein